MCPITSDVFTIFYKSIAYIFILYDICYPKMLSKLSVLILNLGLPFRIKIKKTFEKELDKTQAKLYSLN